MLPARISDRDALVELTAERAAVARARARAATRRSGSARASATASSSCSGTPALPDGGAWVRDRWSGDPDQPAALGEALAERMLAAGAREILGGARRRA